MGHSDRSQDPYFTYAYGDDEPRKPQQYDNGMRNEEPRIWPNKSNLSHHTQVSFFEEMILISS